MSKAEGKNRRTRFEPGSGNVFADVGLAEPDVALARARLAEAIEETIERRGLTQEGAARLMGVDQPTVSKIVNERLDGFSQERLLRYLTTLGNDVEIVIRRPDGYEAQGRLTVKYR